MGDKLFDKYSILHFAVGIIFRFFNINFLYSLIIHSVFEYVENTKQGMHFINNYLPFWPGGKPKADTFINNIGDTISFSIGWLFANTFI
jgi:hypothetical protein